MVIHTMEKNKVERKNQEVPEEVCNFKEGQERHHRQGDIAENWGGGEHTSGNNKCKGPEAGCAWRNQETAGRPLWLK